jgi:hypothetical protein
VPTNVCALIIAYMSGVRRASFVRNKHLSDASSARRRRRARIDDDAMRNAAANGVNRTDANVSLLSYDYGAITKLSGDPERLNQNGPYLVLVEA